MSDASDELTDSATLSEEATIDAELQPVEQAVVPAPDAVVEQLVAPASEVDTAIPAEQSTGPPAEPVHGIARPEAINVSVTLPSVTVGSSATAMPDPVNVSMEVPPATGTGTADNGTVEHDLEVGDLTVTPVIGEVTLTTDDPTFELRGEARGSIVPKAHGNGGGVGQAEGTVGPPVTPMGRFVDAMSSITEGDISVDPPPLPSSVQLDITIVLTMEERWAVEPVLEKVWAVINAEAIADDEEANSIQATAAAVGLEMKSPRPKRAVVAAGLRSIYATLRQATVTPPGIVVVNMASTAIYNLAVNGHL